MARKTDDKKLENIYNKVQENIQVKRRDSLPIYWDSIAVK